MKNMIDEAIVQIIDNTIKECKSAIKENIMREINRNDWANDKDN